MQQQLNSSTYEKNQNNNQQIMTTKKFVAIKHNRLTVALLVFVVIVTVIITGESANAKQHAQQMHLKFRRVPPRQFAATIGSSIVFECEVGGSPQPKIHWLKDGQRISSNSKSFADENVLEDFSELQSAPGSAVQSVKLGLSATKSKLFIDCFNEKDVGTYSCVGENLFARNATHTTLTIQKPATYALSQAISENDIQSANDIDITGEQQKNNALATDVLDAIALGQSESLSSNECRNQQGGLVSDEPRIEMWTHNMVELMKHDVVLYCRTNKPFLRHSQQSSMSRLRSGFDSTLPIISWLTPDGKPINKFNMNKYVILERGDLLIKDLRWSDHGRYTCSVSDGLNSDSQTIFIYPTLQRTEKPTAKRRSQDNIR